MNRSRRNFGFILSASLLAISTLVYYRMDHNSASATAANLPNAAVLKEVVKNNITQANKTNSQTAILTPGLSRKSASKSILRQSFAFGEAGDLVNQFNAAYNDLQVEQAFTPTIVDSYDFNLNSASSAIPLIKQSEQVDPMTIESVVNTYQRTAKKHKIGFQVYFTPTVSYRKLTENQTYKQAPIPGSSAYIDNVNSMVTHKPDFGFEIGVAAKYPLGKAVKLRGGFQFNINRYDIKAFSSPQQTATIRLNDRNSIGQQNTIPVQTNYNNFTGYKTNWLENFYFQVSAPVGLEMKLRGDENMSLGIATTIQPTYVLGDRAYLISTDYKNYVEVPSLIRRLNLNTSFETFVAYSTGHLKWQVGPQVRYQLFSSFVKKYPVKENLFDFGLKVGISLNNQ